MERGWTEQKERDRAVIAEMGFCVAAEACPDGKTVLYRARNEQGSRALFKCVTRPDASEEDGRPGDAGILREVEELLEAGRGEGEKFLLPIRNVRTVSGGDSRVCLQMEWREALAYCFAAGKMTVSDLLGMAYDVCCALNWCRQKVSFYNCLNTANIYRDGGRWLLGDFLFRTAVGNMDPFCIAPELFEQTLPSEKSDLYSLGMVMYRLVNGGKPPFGETQDALDKLREGAMPECPEGCPEELFGIIRKALAEEKERYESIGLMLWDIELLQKKMTPEEGARSLKPVCRPEDPPERRRPKKPKQPEKPKRQKKPKPVPTPEEMEQRKKNRQDGWILTGIVLLSAALLAAGVLWMYHARDGEVYSLIRSEAYAVAFREISERHGEGQNVDALLDAYVEACMDDLQYWRVNQALPLYSDAACTDPEYFTEIVRAMLASRQNRLAAEAAEILSGRSGLTDAMNDIMENYNT